MKEEILDYFKNMLNGILHAIGGVNSNIHNTATYMETKFLKRIDELDQKLDLLLKN